MVSSSPIGFHFERWTYTQRLLNLVSIYLSVTMTTAQTLSNIYWISIQVKIIRHSFISCVYFIDVWPQIKEEMAQFDNSFELVSAS